jgi:Glycosyltransferase family 87
MNFDLGYLLYLAKAAAVLIAAALIFRVRLRPAVVWGLAVVTGVVVLFLLCFLFGALGVDPHVGIDYRFFWGAGRDVWAGVNPYAPDRFAEHPFLNPPSALPLFAAFALLPFPAGYIAWSVLNVVASVALVPLALRVLAAQERLDGRPAAEGGTSLSGGLPEFVLLALISALAVSDASMLTTGIGQLSLMEAVVLAAALLAQSRGRPVVTGALLALATAKVGTMLPFLLLFLRRADWRAWAALGATTLALCLAAGSPGDLPARLATVPERIGQLEAPGQVNDYSFEGTRPENILGFEYSFYCLGLRDRTVIKVGQYAAVLLLGAWVGWQVLGRDRLPRAAACSLVALYSTVFLYHRNYDTVILALPLVYSAGRARLASGRARWLFAACATAILLVLHLNIDVLKTVRGLSLEWGVWGRIVQAVVLPYATWLILLAMALLVWGARAKEKTCLPAPA